jgi:hypothetical protein
VSLRKLRVFQRLGETPDPIVKAEESGHTSKGIARIKQIDSNLPRTVLPRSVNSLGIEPHDYLQLGSDYHAEPVPIAKLDPQGLAEPRNADRCVYTDNAKR